MKKLLAGVFMGAMLALAGTAQADDYPEKPVTAIIPSAAGSSMEIQLRIMQPKMEEVLGQPIVLVAAPGAGTVTGSRQVKDSDPDGYTVLINHLAMHSPYILGKSDFNYKDFEVSAFTFTQPMMVMAKKGAYDSLIDLLEQSAAAPDTILAGVNIGGLNHLAVALAQASYKGASFRYIQTGGTVPSVTSLLGGQTQVGGIGAGETMPYVEDIDMLVVLDHQRYPQAPDVPTFAELGLPDIRLALDTAFFMPKGTPQAAVDKFADALEAAMEDSKVQDSLTKLGLVVDFRRGEAAQQAVADGYQVVLEAAKAAGLNKVDE